MIMLKNYKYILFKALSLVLGLQALSFVLGLQAIQQSHFHLFFRQVVFKIEILLLLLVEFKIAVLVLPVFREFRIDFQFFE